MACGAISVPAQDLPAAIPPVGKHSHDFDVRYWQVHGLIAGLVLVTGLLVGLAYSWRQRQFLQRDFSRQLILTQEEERQRIASKLHDSLGQELLVLKGRLDLIGINHPDVKPALEPLSSNILQAIELARSMAHDLRPPHLELLGLSKALKALALEIEQSTPLSVTPDVDEISPRLSHPQEIGLYRIAQEAFANIIKHANASHTRLTLKNDGTSLMFKIEDDGVGISDTGFVRKRKQRPGLGIAGMSERARLLNAKFHCKSTKGQGMAISVVLNFANAAQCKY